jgi:antitoxin ParD1/3/4
MTSINVSLPEELKEYVEAQSRRGCSTPSEYVQELILEDKRLRTTEKLNSSLLEGLDSGDSLPADSQYWVDLKPDALAALEARRKAAADK